MASSSHDLDYVTGEGGRVSWNDFFSREILTY